jgi:hypothetical protein
MRTQRRWRADAVAAYVWRVELARGWMRRLAPVLTPLFRWNHDGVMRAGGAGLARLLEREGACALQRAR